MTNDLNKQNNIQEGDNTIADNSLESAKSQFLVVAAHQLRTPLSGMKWAFQMLLSGDYGPLNQEQRDVLERGNTMNENMIHLVSDLLNTAKIESGKFFYNLTEIDLYTFLTEVKNLYTKKVQDKHISFDVQIPEAGNIFLRGDKDKLEMVFQNLTDNAFNYTPAGGSVSLSYKISDDGVITFEIKDTGIGIEKEEIPNLFAKFFRGKQAMKTTTDGTGLGLYLASKILQAHDGKIWLESEPGNGTSVFFTLPTEK